MINGNGKLYNKLYDVLKDFVVASSDESNVLLIAQPNYEQLKSLLTDRNSSLNGKEILCFSQLTMAQAFEVDKNVKENNGRLLIASVISHYDLIGSDNALIYYSGDKEVYDSCIPIIERLNGGKYLGDNPVIAPMMDFSANGIHYSYVLAYLVGIAMCRKYEFPVATYLYHTLKSMPALSQAAYRNIWAGLKDSKSYEEVNDVIHGMEMLVCLMKKTEGNKEIENNIQRQMELNKTLSKHWNDLMGEYEAPRKEEV